MGAFPVSSENRGRGGHASLCPPNEPWQDATMVAKATPLAIARRQRLLTAMAAAGIDEIVAYGNGWQSDYLRYVSDFGILEGHGIAVTLCGDIARAVEARLDRVANHRLAAAPRRFLPAWLAAAERTFVIEDGTALLDRLLMHKLPAEIDAIRRAAKIADDAYGEFIKVVTPGRRQYEIVADLEAYLRRRGCPDNFMIIGSGGKDVFGMTPPSERRIASGDLVTTELTPAVDGY